MRQNTVLGVVLSVLNIAALVLAAYLAIDALDLNRQQNARTEQALNRLTGAISRLSENMANMPQPQHGQTTPVSSRPVEPASSPGSFTNDDLRDPDAEDGGSMVTRTQTFPGNLNNLVNNESTVSTIWSYLVASLAQRNNNDLTLYEPMLAERWEVSKDGLEYTIHLRNNIFWHPYVDPVTKKGVPAQQLTSRDFLFFWTTLQNPNIPCEALRGYYEDLKGIEILDDLTFKVIWKRPYSMSESFTLGLQPLPEHYYRPDPSWDDVRFAEEFVSSPRNQWIVGTGPYRLTKWDKNEEVTMERDEAYCGPKPPIKTRRIILMPDNSKSFLEFQRGAIDLYGLQPAQWHEETPEPDFRLVTPNIETANEDSMEWDRKKKAGELPAEYKFEKYQYNSNSWSYIGYNLQRPLFQERTVRVALTYLVDRERILDEVYMGLGYLISGPFVPHSPYYNHEVKPLPFDPAAAAKMLADAGWEDTDGDGILDKDYDGSGQRKPFQFTLIIPSAGTTGRRVAAIMERELIKAKIKMDIKPIEWSVYTQLLEERDYDVCMLGWVGGVEGDPYQIWHGSGARVKASSNHVGYDSPEANRLIEEGRRTVDKEKRYEIYRRLHEVIAHDQPYTFLACPTATVAQSKRFRNVIVYKGGGMDSTLQWIPREMQRTR